MKKRSPGKLHLLPPVQSAMAHLAQMKMTIAPPLKKKHCSCPSAETAFGCGRDVELPVDSVPVAGLGSDPDTLGGAAEAVVTQCRPIQRLRPNRRETASSKACPVFCPPIISVGRSKLCSTAVYYDGPVSLLLASRFCLIFKQNDSWFLEERSKKCMCEINLGILCYCF